MFHYTIKRELFVTTGASGPMVVCRLQYQGENGDVWLPCCRKASRTGISCHCGFTTSVVGQATGWG